MHVMYSMMCNVTLPIWATMAEDRRRQAAMAAGLVVQTIITAAITAVETADPIPYHTSALTGEAWVLELITGHPDRIQCELGVWLHVFNALVSKLHDIRAIDSRELSVEEQLALFLYTCVTRLSTRHVGEQFQRTSDTVSK